MASYPPKKSRNWSLKIILATFSVRPWQHTPTPKIFFVISSHYIHTFYCDLKVTWKKNAWELLKPSCADFVVLLQRALFYSGTWDIKIVNFFLQATWKRFIHLIWIKTAINNFLRIQQLSILNFHCVVQMVHESS